MEGAEPGVTRSVVAQVTTEQRKTQRWDNPRTAKVGLLARQALSGKQCCMQLGRVRWANAELLARQAKDAMRRLKLTTLKLRLTRAKKKPKLSQSHFFVGFS